MLQAPGANPEHMTLSVISQTYYSFCFHIALYSDNSSKLIHVLWFSPNDRTTLHKSPDVELIWVYYNSL